MPPHDPQSATQRLFGFTRDEWIRARTFDLPDDEAEQSVDDLFAEFSSLEPEGFVIDHRDLLLLSYVSNDCQVRVLSVLPRGSLGAALLEKLRWMDRETRAAGELRHPPTTPPL